MPKCTQCGDPTKFEGGLCYSCYKKSDPKKKNAKTTSVKLDNEKKKAAYEELNKQMRDIAEKGGMIHIPGD